MSKSWKAVERQVAKFFGGLRAPLSGVNSKHTSSDVIHPSLYIEVKHRAKFFVWSLWEKTKERAKKEKKLPVLALKEKGKKGFLIIVHNEDWELVIKKWRGE